MKEQKQQLQIIEFINNHPENWRELIKASPYNLNIKEDEHFAILSYSQISSDFSIPMVQECRGLIIDITSPVVKPVALSFPKFFNHGEQYAEKICWSESYVQEKVDGSKILVWYDKYSQKWRVSTSAMLDAYQANVSDFDLSFGDLFDRAIRNLTISEEDFYSLLEPDYCYTFELVSPETRIVVPYKTTKIYFIGVRHIPTFTEKRPSLFTLSNFVSMPKQYPMQGLKECLNVAENMGYDEEGFVVVDSCWRRIKIKSPAYVAAHYLKNNGVNSRKRILEIIEKNEQKEFLSYFPEYADLFSELEQAREAYFTEAVRAVKELQNVAVNSGILSQKDLALLIKQYYNDYAALLFTFLKTDLFKQFVESQWNKLPLDGKLKQLKKFL